MVYAHVQVFFALGYNKHLTYVLKYINISLKQKRDETEKISSYAHQTQLT